MEIIYQNKAFYGDITWKNEWNTMEPNADITRYNWIEGMNWDIIPYSEIFVPGVVNQEMPQVLAMCTVRMMTYGA